MTLLLFVYAVIGRRFWCCAAMEIDVVGIVLLLIGSLSDVFLVALLLLLCCCCCCCCCCFCCCCCCCCCCWCWWYYSFKLFPTLNRSLLVIVLVIDVLSSNMFMYQCTKRFLFVYCYIYMIRTMIFTNRTWHIRIFKVNGLRQNIFAEVLKQFWSVP